MLSNTFSSYLFVQLTLLFIIHNSSISSSAPAVVGNETSNAAVQQDRIITNISDVWDGVPVDYRYNESSTSTSNHNNDASLKSDKVMVSAPGCPKSVEGYPWVYYGSPEKCFLAGEQGPCEPYQKLFIESGSFYGICNCECFEGKKITPGEVAFCKSLSSVFTEYVFIPEKQKCYSLYYQGPCETDQWIAKSINAKNKTTAVCEPRKCPTGQIPQPEGPEGSVAVHEPVKNITCFYPFFSFASPVSIIPNDCGDMKYSELLQKCVKKFAFNLGK